MSFISIPVELDHGRVVAKHGEILPESGDATLTIWQADPPGEAPPARRAPSEVNAILARLTGVFTMPEEDLDDPRLNYLLRKYCR